MVISKYFSSNKFKVIYIVITLLLFYVLMLAFQAIKHVLFPYISMDESHLITNIAGAIFLELLLYVFISKIYSQRQQNEIIKNNEILLNSILNASRTKIILIDTNGAIIKSNATANRVLNVSSDRIISDAKLEDYYSGHNLEQRTLSINRSLETKAPTRFSDNYLGLQFDNYVVPLMNNSGIIDKLAIFSYDITQAEIVRKELELQNRLLESLKQLQDLYMLGTDTDTIYSRLLSILVDFTSSKYGFLDEVLYDADGTPYKLSLAMNNISWDNNSEALYQKLKARELEFRNLDNLAGMPVLKRNTIIANDVPNHPSYKGLPPGHPPLNKYMGIPIFFGDNLIGVAGVANSETDYSEELAQFISPLIQTAASIIHACRLMKNEKENITALRVSEERYRMIVTTAQEGIWILNQESCTTFVNDAMADMLGYTADEMLDKHLFDFMDEEAKNEAIYYLQRRHEGITERHDFRFSHRDGANIWAYIATNPLFDEANNYTGTLGMLMNITERKLIEIELQKSKVKLEKLNMAKDKFFSIIAHDLRNPLGNFREMLRLVLSDDEGLDEAEKMNFLLAMKVSSDNLYTLMENLLEWANSQRGVIKYSPIKTELFAIVDNVFEILALQLIRKNNKLINSIPRNVYVNADQNMLMTILRNLISNANKYTANGIIEISAVTDIRMKRLTVFIRDNGVGIKSELLDKLFIHSNYESTIGTNGEKGTGLGLVITREFVNAHGGKIYAENSESGGALFKFDLPSWRQEKINP